MSEWASYRLKMELDIDGTKVDVISAQTHWDLNNIPRATFILPLGRNVRTLEPSPIHKKMADLTTLLPVTLTVTMTKLGQSGGLKALDPPAETFVLFEGLTAGPGYNRTPDSATFQLDAVHWLAELTHSSMLSVNMHPNNPTNYTTGAVQAGADTGSAAFTTLAIIDEVVTKSNIQTDLWEEAIKKWFLSVASNNTMVINENGIAPDGGPENTGAVAALNRMRSDPALTIIGNLDDSAVVENIQRDLVLQCGNPDFSARHTFWDVLIGKLAAEYLFSVIPRVKDALVVPFVGGNRTIYKTITVAEGVHGQLESRLVRPLRGVGILGSIGNETGLIDGKADTQVPTSITGIGGYFEPDDAAKSGMIHIKRAPLWLSNVLSTSSFARNTAPISGPISSATHPATGSPPSTPIATQTRAGAAAMKGVMDRYAQAIFALDSLKDRQGSLSGPLRFDLAPGSTVKIETASDAFIPDDTFKLPFIGEILRVSHYLSCDPPGAATAFHVAYVRNENENGSDRTSVEKHPLYSEGWSGAPLVEP